MIIEGTWYILGNGIDFEKKEVEILPYLTLRKIDKISIFDLAKLGTKGFHQWSLIGPFCYSDNLFEIVSKENSKEYGYDILNRAWLLNTLLVLRKYVTINSIAFLNHSWNALNTLNLQSVNANLCDYHINMIQFEPIKSVKINESDFLWIGMHFEIANDLAFKYEKFRYALETLNSWRYCIEAKSAIAIIWSAIEGLVDVSQEISFRLSLNISSLLYPRGIERLRKFEDIKKLYTLRSKVIHGNNVKKGDINNALKGSFCLLSELIAYMIEKDKMISAEDFTEAIFK